MTVRDVIDNIEELEQVSKWIRRATVTTKEMNEIFGEESTFTNSYCSFKARCAIDKEIDRLRSLEVQE